MSNELVKHNSGENLNSIQPSGEKRRENVNNDNLFAFHAIGTSPGEKMTFEHLAVMSPAPSDGRSRCPCTHSGCKMKHLPNKLECTPVRNRHASHTDENIEFMCPQCENKLPGEADHYKHVPRRRQLCDHLGGCCYASMVGNISPPPRKPGN